LRKAYVYVQFAEILNPSGALVELGFALGKKLMTTMIIRRNLRTPCMFEGFQGVSARLECLPDARIYLVDDVEDAVRLIKRDGRQLLGLSLAVRHQSPLCRAGASAAGIRAVDE
jgi:hypothetical protein